MREPYSGTYTRSSRYFWITWRGFRYFVACGRLSLRAFFVHLDPTSLAGRLAAVWSALFCIEHGRQAGRQSIAIRRVFTTGVWTLLYAWVPANPLSGPSQTCPDPSNHSSKTQTLNPKHKIHWNVQRSCETVACCFTDRMLTSQTLYLVSRPPRPWSPA